jgi:DNA modification methylase
MLNQVHVGDCLAWLQQLPDACVDLAFADPPFNVGYHYDVYQDRRPNGEYLAWAEQWLAAVARVLKPEGSVFVAIGDEFAAEHKVRLDALGLTLRNWIVWHYTFGVNCTRKFNRSHAHILYYVKDAKRFTFNADAVRVPSARLLKYADPRANPKGKVPNDAWILDPAASRNHFQEDADTWHLPRICGTFKERTTHPCQMPEAVLERIIRVASNPGDIVLDPFAGSGTTLAVAKRLGRRWIGYELSESYAESIQSRIRKVVAP